MKYVTPTPDQWEAIVGIWETLTVLGFTDKDLEDKISIDILNDLLSKANHD